MPATLKEMNIHCAVGIRRRFGCTVGKRRREWRERLFRWVDWDERAVMFSLSVSSNRSTMSCAIEPRRFVATGSAAERPVLGYVLWLANERGPLMPRMLTDKLRKANIALTPEAGESFRPSRFTLIS